MTPLLPLTSPSQMPMGVFYCRCICTNTGADFVHHFRLLDNMHRRKYNRLCNRITRNGKPSNCPWISPVFDTTNNPDPFCELLPAEYNDVTVPIYKSQALKYDVVHYIETHRPPVSARSRRLAPENVKIARDEFQYNYARFGYYSPIQHPMGLPITYGAPKDRRGLAPLRRLQSDESRNRSWLYTLCPIYTGFRSESRRSAGILEGRFSPSISPNSCRAR